MKIRNIIYLALLLLFLQSTSNAEGISREGALKTCTQIEGISGLIMEGRQSGVSMSELMKVSVPGSINEIMDDIVIDAFEKPRSSTQSHKAKTIENFKSKWFLSCYKGMIKDK
jgi:hypothetical protein